jgi:hypothetical protein
MYLNLLNSLLEMSMCAAKATYVLAVKSKETPEDYYVAGTLAEIRQAHQDIVQPVRGNRAEIKCLEGGMQLYKLTAEPAWRQVNDSPSLTATFKALRTDGLKAVGVDTDKVANTVKGMADTVKTQAPGLGGDIRKAVSGGLMDKMKLLGSATSLFGAVAGSLETLKAEGKAAISTVQSRLTGFEGDGIITPDGQKLVHATFLANPENAKPLEFSALKETRKTAPRGPQR